MRIEHQNVARAKFTRAPLNIIIIESLSSERQSEFETYASNLGYKTLWVSTVRDEAFDKFLVYGSSFATSYGLMVRQSRVAIAI